ncbi:hypothetical protein LTR62_002416 [Meristemomyces frigidus]|uniref:PCI domain-containing protein n=1 Tax=Meristemomyces frigidus TaxID=1508187 RepID=A0AAN7TM37_9PEZI|nr:hypothetical protein LTR62_002416 [Meristemomyces frigidus]
MAFGDPSQPYFPYHQPVARQASPSPPLILLDQTWIYRLLHGLNNGGKFGLNEHQLSAIYAHGVQKQVEPYWGYEVQVVFQEVATIIASALSSAVASLRGPALPPPPPPPIMAQTPYIGQFLVAVNGFIQVRNETKLNEYIALEPPFTDHYGLMGQELQTVYPPGREEALEGKCTSLLKAAVEGDDMSPWTTFIKFMAQYLAYLRDVSAEQSKYLETYGLLSELQQRLNSALGHATLGYLVLPTVVANAKLVCRLAIGLDRQPDLIAHLRSSNPSGGGDEGGRETLPERAANILRAAFVTCLNDRVHNLDAQGAPEGKKRGIYTIANLCLKILFQCRKTRNATQIFENIYNSSPPLSAYPKRERVTYLYYLGRFLFQNSHFYRAQLALQYAYDEAPARQECVRQRRQILVYLIASNIILGRFPSQALLSRPEAQGLAELFLPICLAIRAGNLVAFRRHLSLDGEQAPWFLHFRILLQMRNRCEILVWRSLVRKIFLLVGYRPVDPVKASTLSTDHLVTAWNWLESLSTAGEGQEVYTDPDFAEIADGNSERTIDITAMESKVAALIDQGLVSAFISRKLVKVAFLTKAVQKGGDALTAAFPRVWGVLSERVERGGGKVGEVPGWKRDFVGVGGGVVVNLRGVGGIGVHG